MSQPETVYPDGASLPSVSGALSFILPQETKPVFHSSALTGGEPKVFFEMEERVVAVADMRPIADKLSIDEQGFELLVQPTAVDDLFDVAAVEGDYYSEIKAMLLERFGASQVAIFDATRRSDGESGAVILMDCGDPRPGFMSTTRSRAVHNVQKIFSATRNMIVLSRQVPASCR